jgi:hypothetical protein
MQTSIEWLWEQIPVDYTCKRSAFEVFEQAKEMHKQEIIEDIIGFQIYLHDNGLITNHDWEFEKLAKLYVKKEYARLKK